MWTCLPLIGRIENQSKEVMVGSRTSCMKVMWRDHVSWVMQGPFCVSEFIQEEIKRDGSRGRISSRNREESRIRSRIDSRYNQNSAKKKKHCILADPVKKFS